MTWGFLELDRACYMGRCQRHWLKRVEVHGLQQTALIFHRCRNDSSTDGPNDTVDAKNPARPTHLISLEL